jgi:hypothetical protein
MKKIFFSFSLLFVFIQFEIMGEILILKSINGRILTDKLVDSWFDTNEMFVTKKSFSDDRCSVEVTFIDEESMK